MTTTSRNILLRGDGYKKEGVAGSAITPGMLVALAADGKWDPHGAAASNAMRAFAMAPEWVGDNPTIDTAYALDDQMLIVCAHPGNEIYALVATAAPAIVIGDFLESAGDGTLVKAVADAATDTAQRAAIVGQALEALTNVSGSNARLRIQVI